VRNTTRRRRRWRPESARRRVRVLCRRRWSSAAPSVRDALSSPDDLHLHSRSPPAHAARRPTAITPHHPPAVRTAAVAVTRPSRITHTLIYIQIYCVCVYIYIHTIYASSRCNSKAAAAWHTHTHTRERYTHRHHTIAAAE